MTPTGRVVEAPVGMSMTSSTSQSHGGFRANSPVPYLFGGIALVLVLIAVALILIVFSNKKRSDDDDDEDQKGGASTSSMTMADYNEQKFAVFMPGEKKPTFLANPVELRICVCNRSTTDERMIAAAAEPAAAAEQQAAGLDELV